MACQDPKLNPVRIAALLTCHNRREKTLQCLASLFFDIPGHISLTVFLVDDGSTDGTAAAVRQFFPEVIVISGNGDLYWAGGMRVAFKTAARLGEYDYYLWLNDDVVLDNGALLCALSWADNYRAKPAVLVGTIRDVATGKAIYGGMRRPSMWRALYFEPVTTDSHPIPCDTCSGNFLLIPSAIAMRVEMIDNIFRHACGDYDYGFRVRRYGYPLLVIPGSVGTSARNPFPNREDICRLSIIERWQRITGPKLFPIRPWFTYTYRHTGLLWPIFFVRPYVEVFWPRLFRILR